MSEDMRQGVTPAVHEVLDAVGQFRALDRSSSQRKLIRAAENVRIARATVPLGRRSAMVVAAVLLILAIEALDEERKK